MRNINANLTGTRARIVTFVLAAWMMSGLSSASRSVATASTPLVQKVQQVQRESREIIRFSVRLYRFYKQSAGPAVMQNSACE